MHIANLVEFLSGVSAKGTDHKNATLRRRGKVSAHMHNTASKALGALASTADIYSLLLELTAGLDGKHRNSASTVLK